MIYAISNEFLEVKISSLGAEIQSIKKNGREVIWQGDPAVWEGHSPILFPICGGLKEDRFIYEGKEYFLEKHGFARRSEFEPVKIGAETAVFVLKSSEETLKKYPFEFELKITYTLKENTVCVEYAVENRGTGDMYFSVGAHEAYTCPGGIEGYSVVFEKNERLDSNITAGNVIEHKTVNYGENVRVLDMKNEYFSVDALIFQNLNSRRVTLKNRTTGKGINIEFADSDYLLIWTKPGAEFLCIEPWCGIPDFADSNGDITRKPGIIRAEAGEVVIKRHSFEIE